MGLRNTIELYKIAERMAGRNRTEVITESQARAMKAADTQRMSSTKRVRAALREQRLATLKPPAQQVVFVKAGEAR